MNFAGSKLSIDIPSLSSAGKTSSYTDAGVGDVGKAFNTLANQRIDSGEVYRAGATLRNQGLVKALQLQGDVARESVKAFGDVTSVKNQVDAEVEVLEEAKKERDKAAKRSSWFEVAKSAGKLGLGLATGGASTAFTSFI